MKRAMATEMQLRQQRGWWVSKRALVMGTVTKRAMATDGDNTGNGDGKEGGEQATAATVAMGRGTARRTWLLTLRLERGG
jgi:hypothetical protein